ncbi:DNA glycosylase [Staphylotrichum tortipilum]|uniref:DNA glycosylase n=1 Tax=Staphylotrichum tortipilum TaxID=2831512 RepID=A0AAN6MQ43_9PEZI|nr:DNA glycosylase [Staphylotrichum longicolle]
MRTRAATKRLAEMAGAADNGADSPSGPTEGAQAQDIIDNLATDASGSSRVATQAQDIIDNLATDTSGSSRMATAGGIKRKRASKKQAQPLKGGWVLPHGMGSGVTDAPLTSEDTQSTSTPTSLLPGPSVDVETPAQDTPEAVSRPSNTEMEPVQKKQTRLILRVSKANAHAQMKDQEEQVGEPVVKLEDKDDERPRKRSRGVPEPAENTSGAVVSGTAEMSTVSVKTEDHSSPDKSARKVLIIQGIAIKDDIATKVSETIVVDASQILNPNYRLMIKRGKENPYGLTPGFSPYPYRLVPTPDACEEVHRILTELHGEVTQPEKLPPASLEIAGCGEVPCVLDALLRTLISGNTTMALADAAIKNLAQHYGLRQEGTGAGSINWDKVRLSSHQELTQVIKVAGNGPRRSIHIKQILDMVHDESLEQAETQASTTGAEASTEAGEAGKPTQKPLSLDHMHGLSKDEAMAKFVSYPGIGIKTAACVTLFCLRMPCFAVDTHVHKFCRWLGWTPEKADPDNCFRHGDFMVPDHLKYGLHQLFIRHGQLCFKCRKVTKPGTKDWKEAPDCPLEHLLDRSKDEAGTKPKTKQAKEAKEEEDSGTDDDSEVESKKTADDSYQADEADAVENEPAAAAEGE